ncbi:hypothetical protein B0A55_08974, partial [Friedmanniomyces simplex]
MAETTRTISSSSATVSISLGLSGHSTRVLGTLNSLALLGEHHAVYSDDRTAGLLNQCHRLAILVDELAITRHLNLQRKGLLARHEIFSLQNLRLDLIEHVHAICASVPRLLKSGRIEAAKGLLWPLYVAAQLNPRTVTL